MRARAFTFSLKQYGCSKSENDAPSPTSFGDVTKCFSLNGRNFLWLGGSTSHESSLQQSVSFSWPTGQKIAWRWKSTRSKSTLVPQMRPTCRNSTVRWPCPHSKCNMLFSTKGNAKRHFLAIHRRLKPYCCSICGKRFARKADAKIHLRTHKRQSRLLL